MRRRAGVVADQRRVKEHPDRAPLSVHHALLGLHGVFLAVHQPAHGGLGGGGVVRMVEGPQAPLDELFARVAGELAERVVGIEQLLLAVLDPVERHPNPGVLERAQEARLRAALRLPGAKAVSHVQGHRHGAGDLPASVPQRQGAQPEPAPARVDVLQRVALAVEGRAEDRLQPLEINGGAQLGQRVALHLARLHPGLHQRGAGRERQAEVAVVGHHGGLGQVVHQRAIALLAGAQGLGGVLALGHVHHLGDQVLRRAGRVAHQRCGLAKPSGPAVRVQVAPLRGVHPDSVLVQRLQAVAVLGQLVGVGQVVPARGQELLLGESRPAAQRGVHSQQPAVQAHDRHAGGGVAEGAGEPLLGLLQGTLGLLALGQQALAHLRCVLLATPVAQQQQGREPREQHPATQDGGRQGERRSHGRGDLECQGAARGAHPLRDRVPEVAGRPVDPLVAVPDAQPSAPLAGPAQRIAQGAAVVGAHGHLRTRGPWTAARALHRLEDQESPRARNREARRRRCARPLLGHRRTQRARPLSIARQVELLRPAVAGAPALRGDRVGGAARSGDGRVGEQSAGQGRIREQAAREGLELAFGDCARGPEQAADAREAVEREPQLAGEVGPGTRRLVRPLPARVAIGVVGRECGSCHGRRYQPDDHCSAESMQAAHGADIDPDPVRLK